MNEKNTLQKFHALVRLQMAGIRYGQSVDNIMLRETWIDAWHEWVDTL